jgi:hypothetical protein
MGMREKKWLTILFAFGSIYWYLASVGSAWYLAHVTATFFLLLALNEALGKGRPFLTGLLIGAAYWCRLPTIFSTIFFFYLLQKGHPFRKIIFRFGVGLLIFLVANAAYNWFRFGVPYDLGYTLIPGVLKESWYNQGLINLTYVPKNFQIFMFQLPKILDHFPYLIPSHAGQGILLTTPAFVFSLRASLRKSAHLLAWLSILATLVFILSHGGTGFSQFGFRYATDFYPLLFFLTTKGIGEKLEWYHRLLIISSVLLNLWGVIMINKFNLIDW